MLMLIRLPLVLILMFSSVFAVADTYSFSYIFDANVQGTPKNTLRAIVDGTLQNDGDTVLVNKVLFASLAGRTYLIGSDSALRANDINDPPIISLSGNKLDLWFCAKGFSSSDGSCPFGDEGGFLVSDNFGDEGSVIAGIPEIQALVDGVNTYRDIDKPINKNNWGAQKNWEPVPDANGKTYSFTYVFEASVRGTAGNELRGVLNGTLQDDGDTIVINKILAASLGGFAYKLADDIGVRSGEVIEPATISLSGQNLNFWVCVQGFDDNTGSAGPSSGGGGADCPFGDKGGFLITKTVFEEGSALAGSPSIVELNSSGSNGYRDIDSPVARSNWSAVEVNAYSFSYKFEANVSGSAGNKLIGIIDGTLQEDGDTIVVNNVYAASLAGFVYNIKPQPGLRANDSTAMPMMSLSGQALDFWVCPQGFSKSDSQGAGDCSFGDEGGFVVSDKFGSEGSAIAGIPEIKELVDGVNQYRDLDRPINKGNWAASSLSGKVTSIEPTLPVATDLSVAGATELSVAIDGTAVRLSWTAVLGATGYRLYFAPSPLGSPIQKIDLGGVLEVSGNLPSGTSLFVAIETYNEIGNGKFSNVANFSIE